MGSTEQKRANLQEQVFKIKSEIIALQDKNANLVNEIKIEQKKRTAHIPRLIKEKENFILTSERRSEDLHNSSLVSIDFYTEEFRGRMGDEENQHLRRLCLEGSWRREEDEEIGEEERRDKQEKKKSKKVGEVEGEAKEEDRRGEEEVRGQEEEGEGGKEEGKGGKEEDEKEEKEERRKKRRNKKRDQGIFSFLANKEYVLTGLLLLIPLYFITNSKHY